METFMVGERGPELAGAAFPLILVLAFEKARS
jgi:hypothetical protein